MLIVICICGIPSLVMIRSPAKRNKPTYMMNLQLRYCTTNASWDTYLKSLARGSIDFYPYHTLQFMHRPGKAVNRGGGFSWARSTCYLSPVRPPEGN